MNKKKMTVEVVVRQAVIAALYVVLTVVLSPISYGNIQFRLAELLVFLVLYRKDYIFGLTLGCFIANLFSPMLIWDITFGVAATIIALVLMIVVKNIYIASIFPVVVNGLIVGMELYFALGLPFALSALEVAAGEAVVMVVGILVFKLLERNKGVMYFISLDEKYLESKASKTEE